LGAVVTRPRRRLDGLEPEVEALHARLLDGDPLAPYALCGLLLRPMKQWACRHVKDADDDVAEDGALEALRKYFGNPRLYDPRRGRLLGWLRKCAVNATRNLMKRPRRGREHEVAGIDLDAVALTAPGHDGEAIESRRREQRRLIRRVLTDPVERAFADAHLDGRPIPVQAEIIGAAHLTEADQRRLVARWWHRIREKAKWWIRRSRVREIR